MGKLPMIKAIYVDDEPNLLEVIKEYLELDDGITVDTSTSASHVLSQLSKTRYDVIISDYQMPGMDGLQFLKKLRSNGDQTPFIIFTGKGREEVVTEALGLGANLYLQKGTDTHVMCLELSNAVRQLFHMANAEKASRISEYKYQDLLENSNSLIITADLSGNVTFMNRYARRFFGFAEDVVGKNLIGTILAVSDRSRMDLVRMRHGWLNDPDRFNSVVVKNQKSNGDIVWIAWSSKATRDANGKIIGIKSVGNDITAQMTKEDELETCKRIMRMTADSMPVPILSVGWKGEIMTCNKQFLHLFGLAPVPVGEESVELLPRIYSMMSNPKSFEAEVLNTAASEGPDKVVRMQLKDGRKLNFIPVPPQDTSPVAMVWCVGSERGGKMVRSDYLSFCGNDVADNSPDLLLQIDGDGTITYASKSHMEALGREPLDLMGRSIEDLMAPGEGRKLFNLLNEAAMDKKSGSIDLHMRRIDGTFALFNVHLRSFYDPESNVAGAVLSSRMIEEEVPPEPVPEAEAALASMLRDTYNLDF
jgi:PAS domain S-box-containing protein